MEHNGVFLALGTLVRTLKVAKISKGYNAEYFSKGKAPYTKRKSTVKTVFGIINHMQGFRQFHLGALNPSKVYVMRMQ
ncbi:hypothetical protein AU255_17595 [Methyloprofundus sedimenti]|uniref:Transposase DDE domain-containing protein n=1 Tax=Methyloprofundus sedimenti TaxID=1420851 RepID=A0A1V8M1A7_9GAMM|nr:hypothetical protein [Methyloprofundus sedimenti]OQK15288.1 hypothetical protein AU255_17595 [Methyloprofundus sedimenti]